MNEKLQLQKNKILYLDTSETEAVLVVYLNGQKEAETKWEAPRELSRTLTFKYQEILSGLKMAEGELDAIVVFGGPGSFTGLRIGISFANALAYALGIPIFATKIRNSLDLSKPEKVITPFYGAEPKITKPKKK